MIIKFKKLKPNAVIPAYAHGPNEDAGLDLVSTEEQDLAPGQPHAVCTGISIELPAGYHAEIRPRSGLALNHAITVANAPGTIDSGYRGEIQVILINNGMVHKQIHMGQKIAQMVIMQHVAAEMSEVGELSASDRGSNGFGSTDKAKSAVKKES